MNEPPVVPSLAKWVVRPGPVPPVVVHPVVDAWHPFRRVEVLGTQVGKAYALADVLEFMRLVGLDEADVRNPDRVQWQVNGPDVWE